LIGIFVRILKVPYEILGPIITVFCFLGAYSINNNATGILIVIVFGVVGYLMRYFEYDAAPLVLAMVLGPLMEDSLRQSLMLFRGDVTQIVHRPIALVFLGIAGFLLVSPLLSRLLHIGFSNLFSKKDQR